MSNRPTSEDSSKKTRRQRYANVEQNGAIDKQASPLAVTAAHHSYDLDTHQMIKRLINDARKLSLKHQRCPFILSGHKEAAGNKEHISQVRPRKLSRDFATVRNACELEWPAGRKPASFHEIKGLYIRQGLQHYTAQQM